MIQKKEPYRNFGKTVSRWTLRILQREEEREIFGGDGGGGDNRNLF